MNTRRATVHGTVHGLAIESHVVISPTGDVGRSWICYGNSHLTLTDARALLAALTAAVLEASLRPSIDAGPVMPGDVPVKDGVCKCPSKCLPADRCVYEGLDPCRTIAMGLTGTSFWCRHCIANGSPLPARGRP